MRESLLILLGLFAATPGAAQSFRFHYTPAPGRVVTSLTELRMVTTMTGLPRVPDGTTLEMESRIYAHERVTGAVADGRTVNVAIDSARVRAREGESPWIDAESPPFAGHETEATVDEHLHVTGIATSAPEDGVVLRTLTAWAANLGFSFPDSAVQVGVPFRTGAQLPFEVTVSQDLGLGVHEVLMGDLQLTLDSLSTRGTDTLAFLRFTGAFSPRTIESTGEAGTRHDTFEGGFAGSLLWSTGWDAFVSGGVRVRVTGHLHQEAAGGVTDATVNWDATLVHRIRP